MSSTSLTEPGISQSTVVNDHDHGALIVVTAALGTSCWLLFYAARLAIRWPWKTLFAADDVVTTIASVRVFPGAHTFARKP